MFFPEKMVYPGSWITSEKWFAGGESMIFGLSGNETILLI